MGTSPAFRRGLGSEGEFHRRQHDLLAPLVHASAIDSHARTVVEGGIRMQRRWADGQVVDVFELLAETTLTIMVEVLFGTSVDRPDGRALRDALTESVDALEDLPLPVLSGVERLPLPGNRRFEKAKPRLDSMLLDLVAERLDGLDGERLDRQPAAFAKLIAHLLRGTQPPCWGCCHYLAEIVPRLREQSEPADVKAIVEEAMRLGCNNAPEW